MHIHHSSSPHLHISTTLPHHTSQLPERTTYNLERLTPVDVPGAHELLTNYLKK